jgi:hypothetical protein
MHFLERHRDPPLLYESIILSDLAIQLFMLRRNRAGIARASHSREFTKHQTQPIVR